MVSQFLPKLKRLQLVSERRKHADREKTQKKRERERERERDN